MVMIDIPYIYFLFSNRLNVIFTKFDEVQKSGTMIQSANGEWGNQSPFLHLQLLGNNAFVVSERILDVSIWFYRS